MSKYSMFMKVVILVAFGWIIGWLCSLMLPGYWLLTFTLGTIIGMLMYKEINITSTMKIMAGYTIAILQFSTGPWWYIFLLWLVFSISTIVGMHVTRYHITQQKSF